MTQRIGSNFPRSFGHKRAKRAREGFVGFELESRSAEECVKN